MATPREWETERTLLGCAMLDPTILDESTITPEDFARPPHANLWRLLLELRANGSDGGLYLDAMHRVQDAPQDYDGSAYVAAHPSHVPSVEVWRSAQTRLQRTAHTRRTVDTLRVAIEAIQQGGDVDAVTAATEQRLVELSLMRAAQADPWRSSGDLATAVLDDIQRAAQDPTTRTERVIPLPWPGVTRMLRGGMRRGEMVVIAGRPGTGKTAAAMQIVDHAAQHGGVLVVSLEMRAESLLERDLARVGEVDHTRIAESRLDAADFRRLVRAVETLTERPVWVLDTPAMTVSKVAAMVRQKVAKLRVQGCEVRTVMVDYLQLISAEARRGGQDSEAQLLADVSKALTALAKATDVALLAVAQMNRNVEGRGETARPRMSDLRGSGQIEQDAAAVLFTANPADPEEFERNPDHRALVVAKARHGVTGECPMLWMGERMSLRELDDRW